MVQELNGMTLDEVQLSREQIIKDIASRASQVAAKWWQGIVVAADQWLHLGGTEYVIGLCVDEACEKERNAK